MYDTLSHDIAVFGIERFDEEVRAIADHAYRRGIAPILAGILGDPTAPPVARERAFARLVAALERHPDGITNAA